MLHRRGINRGAGMAVIVILAALLTTGSASAQLSTEDIAALQQQGREEGWTFVVTKTPATDYALEDLCGLVEPPNWQKYARFDPCTPKDDLPARFDWRDSTTLPSCRNQGGCGSCWAFATVGVLECLVKIVDDYTVDLSEQFLVSCNYEGWSCDGGWFAHDYHEWKEDYCDSVGAVYESSFPYVAADVDCECPFPHPYVIDSWSFIGSGEKYCDEEAVKYAIITHGPVSVSVRSNWAMQTYGGGIFNACETGTVNHSVVLVGWDDNQGENGVWFLRNSWGTGWGEDGGYMRIPYDCSNIGYAACYVVYNGVPKMTFDYPVGRPKEVAPGQQLSFDVVVEGVNGGSPVPGTGLVHYSLNGSGYLFAAMDQTSTNHYTAQLPLVSCGEELTYYVSVVEESKGRLYDPSPAYALRIVPYTDTLMTMSDNFESDKGWTTWGDAGTGQWERGVPVNDDRGDPPSDYDGSGQCFVTCNQSGCDVDEGYAYLVSPVFDLAGRDGLVSYARWYCNDWGHDPHENMFLVSLSNDNGGTWTNVESVGPITESSGGWVEHSFWVGDYMTPTDQMKVRFEASDLTLGGAVIEAAIDAFTVLAYDCGYDGDGDGVANGEDNCPFVYNPLQEDADSDEVGDSCDVCPLDPENDVDNDGFCGGVDNCPDVANPGQEDSDGDGIGDACCCVGSTGNVDDDPQQTVDMGDLTVLIDHLFISLEPVDCPAEANVDATGGVDMGDLTRLIDHLFIDLSPLPECP